MATLILGVIVIQTSVETFFISDLNFEKIRRQHTDFGHTYLVFSFSNTFSFLQFSLISVNHSWFWPPKSFGELEKETRIACH